jgi:hypothetical protein
MGIIRLHLILKTNTENQYSHFKIVFFYFCSDFYLL